MWIGLVNPDLVSCTGKADCTDKVKWIDGTLADAASVSHLDVSFIIK